MPDIIPQGYLDTMDEMDICCHKCAEGKTVEIAKNFQIALSAAMMILCRKCGNKRCPKASDHTLACTGSNDPGQEGSIYQMTGPPQ